MTREAAHGKSENWAFGGLLSRSQEYGQWEDQQLGGPTTSPRPSSKQCTIGASNAAAAADRNSATNCGRDEQRWRGESQWRDEPKWNDDGRHDERRGYDDRRRRGERERDYYDRHDDWHHDPRRDHDRCYQPQHSNRRLGPLIPDVRGRDERQSHDARMRNERPSSSRAADGNGQVDPRKLTASISQAGSADALLALFDAHSTSLNHIHAAALWNKVGKQRIERRHEEQLERLVQRTLDLVSSCEARQLANVSHGVARCGLQSRVVHPLYAAVAEAAVRGGLAGFKPQELANTVWVFATAGVAADALFAAVAEAAVRARLAGFNPQDLANTVWAFATAGVMSSKPTYWRRQSLCPCWCRV